MSKKKLWKEHEVDAVRARGYYMGLEDGLAFAASLIHKDNAKFHEKFSAAHSVESWDNVLLALMIKKQGIPKVTV